MNPRGERNALFRLRIAVWQRSKTERWAAALHGIPKTRQAGAAACENCLFLLPEQEQHSDSIYDFADFFSHDAKALEYQGLQYQPDEYLTSWVRPDTVLFPFEKRRSKRGQAQLGVWPQHEPAGSTAGLLDAETLGNIGTQLQKIGGSFVKNK